MPTQVFIIDGADSMRALMRMVLRNTAFQIAGEAGTLQSALQKISLQRVDMVILDGDIQDGPGVDSISLLKGHYPDVVVVVASTHRDSTHVQSALQQGALGYVIKPFTAGALEDCLARAWRRGSNQAKTVEMGY